MYKYVVFALIVCFGVTTKAQINCPVLGNTRGLPTQAQCEEMKSRKVVVMLPELNENKIKQFEKKKEYDELAQYKKDFVIYKQAIKDGVKAHWNLHDFVSFKSTEEVMSLAKKGNKDSVVIIFGATYSEYVNGALKLRFSFGYSGGEREFDNKEAEVYYQKCLIIAPIEKVDVAESLINSVHMAISLPHAMIDNESIVYGIDFVNYVVKQKLADKTFGHHDISKNASKLSAYTLAVNQEDWSSEISTADAKDKYGLTIELMDSLAFNTLLNTGQPGIAYAVKMGPYLSVVLSDTREVVYLTGLGDKFMFKLTPTISEKELENLQKKIAGMKVEGEGEENE